MYNTGGGGGRSSPFTSAHHVPGIGSTASPSPSSSLIVPAGLGHGVDERLQATSVIISSSSNCTASRRGQAACMIIEGRNHHHHHHYHRLQSGPALSQSCAGRRSSDSSSERREQRCRLALLKHRTAKFSR